MDIKDSTVTTSLEISEIPDDESTKTSQKKPNKKNQRLYRCLELLHLGKTADRISEWMYPPVAWCEDGLLDVTPRGRYVSRSVSQHIKTWNFHLKESPRAQRNLKKSPLLRLPPEVRHRIFEYALSGGYITLVGFKNVSRAVVAGGRKNLFALSRVCRQTYVETALMPFALTTFTYYGDKQFSLDLWAKARLPVQVAAVRKAHICIFGSTPTTYPGEFQPSMCAFKALHGLQSIDMCIMLPKDLRGKYVQTPSMQEYEAQQYQEVQRENPGVKIRILRLFVLDRSFWRVCGMS